MKPYYLDIYCYDTYTSVTNNVNICIKVYIKTLEYVNRNLKCRFRRISLLLKHKITLTHYDNTVFESCLTLFRSYSKEFGMLKCNSLKIFQSFRLLYIFCIFPLFTSAVFADIQDSETSLTIRGSYYERSFSPDLYILISYGVLSEYRRVGDPEYWKKLYYFYEKINNKRHEFECRPEALKGFKDIDELKSYYQTSFSHPDKRIREYFKNTFIMRVSVKHSISLINDHILDALKKDGAKDQYRYKAANSKRSAIIPYHIVSKAIASSVMSNNPEDLPAKADNEQETAIFSLCSPDIQEDEQRYILVKPLSKESIEIELVMPQEGDYQDPFYYYAKKGDQKF